MGRASGRKRRRRASAAAPAAPHPEGAHWAEPFPCGCPRTPPALTCGTHGPPPQPRGQESQEGFSIELGLLEVAVPLWIERFRPMAWEDRVKIRDECLDVIAGDKGLGGIEALATGTRPKKAGKAAEAFNALAKALALGALQPGGVKFGGMHFEAPAA
jgi:hypothetical protein